VWYSLGVDIERTMQFILDSQAKAEIRMQKAESRMQRAESRMEKIEARSAAMEERFDRRLNGITKILKQGMRMLARTETKLAELAESQKETDRELKAFIKSLRNGRNGR